MSDTIFVGKAAMSLDTAPELEPITRVTVKISDEQSFTTGNDTGRTLTVDNPFGTQQMCQNILNKVKDYAYKPFSSRSAYLSPAAELGDGVKIGGIYSGIYSRDESFSNVAAADISAPGEQEVNHEYPIPTMAKKIKDTMHNVTGLNSSVGGLSSRIGGLEEEVEGSYAALNTFADKTGAQFNLLASFQFDGNGNPVGASVKDAALSQTAIMGIANANAAKLSSIASFNGNQGTINPGAITEAAITQYADEKYASITLQTTVTGIENKTDFIKLQSGGIYIYSTNGGAGNFIAVTPGGIYISTTSGGISLENGALNVSVSGGISMNNKNILDAAEVEANKFTLGGTSITSWSDISTTAKFG